MLPKTLRESLFEKASVKTMRYVKAVPIKSATGKTKEIFDMIAEDFFVNGSLSSHSQVPDLFAGTWLGGREVILVTDQLDRTTKEAMGATLSYLNDCPYCADMLVSLVHGGGHHRAASNILDQTEAEITDDTLRERLQWVRKIHGGGEVRCADLPFTDEQLPEALGVLFVLNYVNRFSHVVMDGSPVGSTFKNTALRLFGYELRETTERAIMPGRGLALLPEAPIPDDLHWARPNPRVADALARWIAAVEREAEQAIPQDVRDLVTENLSNWAGETMPLSRAWVEDEVQGLTGESYHLAKLILIVSKASYQYDDSLIKAVMGDKIDEPRLIRILSFAAVSASRRLSDHIMQQLNACAARTATEAEQALAIA